MELVAEEPSAFLAITLNVDELKGYAQRRIAAFVAHDTMILEYVLPDCVLLIST